MQCDFQFRFHLALSPTAQTQQRGVACGLGYHGVLLVLGVPQSATALKISLRILAALRRRGLLPDEDTDEEEDLSSQRLAEETEKESGDSEVHDTVGTILSSDEEEEETLARDVPSSEFDEYETDVFFSGSDIQQGLRESREGYWPEDSDSAGNNGASAVETSQQSRKPAASEAVHAIKEGVNNQPLFASASFDSWAEKPHFDFQERETEPLPIALPKGLSPESLGLYYRTGTPQNARLCGRPPFSTSCVDNPDKPIVRVRYRQTARELLDALGADGIYYGFVVSSTLRPRYMREGHWRNAMRCRFVCLFWVRCSVLSLL